MMKAAAEVKALLQPTLHSGCYESIERLVVALGRECADYALFFITMILAHVREFKF